MKLFQSVLLVALFIVLSSVNVYAQKGKKKSPEEIAKQQTEWMTKELKLDEKQQQKIAKINLDFSKKIDETRKEYSGNREAMQSAMKVHRKEKDKEMKEALTNEQYELYKEKLAERRNNFKKKKGGMK